MLKNDSPSSSPLALGIEAPSVKAGFHLNECNDSAEAARAGACVVGSNVDSPAADLGRIG